jgi:hypothetical protein
MGKYRDQLKDIAGIADNTRSLISSWGAQLALDPGEEFLDVA